jgi:group II intron reverse transcriptase/maturase
MQPDAVHRRLEALSTIAAEDKPVNGLFRLLASPVIWEMAYASIRTNKGAMTPGVDGLTIEALTPDRIQSIIDQVMTGTYRFSPARRVYIPKPNGGKRPLGIPTAGDKLVQSACRLILERIYEPVFSDRSFGFRPGRSCLTALSEIKHTWNGAVWLIEADLRDCFGSFNHSRLLALLAQRVQDKNFLRLIGGMLKAGYLEDWQYHRTFSGTPQGGVISPLLANVYLHELDEFVERLVRQYSRGAHRAANPEYQRVANRLRTAREQRDRLGPDATPEAIAEADAKIADLARQMRSLPSKDAFDPSYRRAWYARYADDFLLGTVGTKEEALGLKTAITEFIIELDLAIAPEKTRVVKSEKGVIFLGYTVQVENAKRMTRVTAHNRTVTKRMASRQIKLAAPFERLRRFANSHGYGNLDTLHASSRPGLTSTEDAEIISLYNAEIRGLLGYYQLARPASGNDLNRLVYLWQTSLLRTLAHRHNSTVTAQAHRLKSNGNSATYRTQTGKTRRIKMWQWSDYKARPTNDWRIDRMPSNWQAYAGDRVGMIQRFGAEHCEQCGATENLTIHHIHAMRDTKDLTSIQRRRSARIRNTIVLCHACHRARHGTTINADSEES